MVGTKARLIASRPVTKKIILARFTLGKPIDFTAGQYVTVALDMPSGKTVERPFSIASSPRLSRKMEFIIELKKTSPVGTFFSKAKKGSTIRLRDPKGAMTVNSGNQALHFIAAGMGLAPFRSICQDLIGRGYKGHVRFSHLREPSSWGPIDEELAEWYKTWKNFSYSLIHTSIEQASEPQWQWRHLSLGDPSHGELTYLCGSPTFVENLSREMRSRGFASKQIVTG